MVFVANNVSNARCEFGVVDSQHNAHCQGRDLWRLFSKFLVSSRIADVPIVKVA